MTKTFAWLAMGLLAIGSAALASETGFEGGNQINITRYFGSVWFRCQTAIPGGDMEFYQCQGNDVHPGEFARFVTDAGGDANKVELTAVRADGSTKTKEEGFDPASGKSMDTFNLLVSTLFQRPLLKMGENRVHYKLKHDDEVRREGDFAVTVGEDPTVHQCETNTIWDSIGAGCHDEISACRRYFADPTTRCQ